MEPTIPAKTTAEEGVVATAQPPQSDSQTLTANLQSSPNTKEWTPTLLHLWSLFLFIALNLCLVATISVLWVLSKRKNGFVSVGYALSAYGDAWRLSLLWTALPSLAFTCLGLYWDAIQSAASDRQPFVELAFPEGSPAIRTILLDYKSMIPHKRLIKMFKNGHWILGVAQLAAWSFAILSSLSSNLLIASVASIQQQVRIVFTGTFDQSLMSEAMDTRAVLDSVTATLVYRAGHVPWTDQEYAFAPFRGVFDTEGGLPPTNATSLTAETTAHSAYLNCAVLNPATDFTMTASGTPTQNTVAKITVTGTDRGCPIRQEFDVGSYQGRYLVTSASITCGTKASYSRLIFTYGQFSPSSPQFLSNISVISCAAGYRSTTGELAVTIPSSSSSLTTSAQPEILSFTPTSPPQDSRHDSFGFWRPFELALFKSQAFSVDTAWVTTDFGTVVLYRALQIQDGGAVRSSTKNGTVVLRGDVLAEAVSVVFTSVYSIGMATAGLVPAQQQQGNATGTLETELTRLYVVPWVAGTILAALAVLCVIAGLVLWYARKHETRLYEEPVGLLAQAALIVDGGLVGLAKGVMDREGFDGRVVDTVVRERKNNAQKESPVNGYWKMYRESGMRMRIGKVRSE